ncbi:hypothetical protein PUNSTDRAFT_41498 [Punctularia strigosozonata HHB-11173 SS5]|uniref:uncharacterized protein n=1 Tax=Punctularia strigosozonata (strain HHB-11173) TaxID=741275 RepID=UPI00044171BC|nr:uncharacterized protein PUNSTDRAFT_41498 [Punctularia strigosozonata HHB-11173 SS5]EIN14226.1 hypothetical protein PUNSTDRAFT_41498 [Punctularia strigosozonata HHB-11173 SS5]
MSSSTNERGQPRVSLDEVIAKKASCFTRKPLPLRDVSTRQLLRDLQTRLRYAKLKVDNGWPSGTRQQRQTLSEVENICFRRSQLSQGRAARTSSAPLGLDDSSRLASTSFARGELSAAAVALGREDNTESSQTREVQPDGMEIANDLGEKLRGGRMCTSTLTLLEEDDESAPLPNGFTTDSHPAFNTSGRRNVYGGLETPFEVGEKLDYFRTETSQPVDSGTRTPSALDEDRIESGQPRLTSPGPPLHAPLPVHALPANAQLAHNTLANRLNASGRAVSSRQNSPFALSPSLQHLPVPLTSSQHPNPHVNHVSTAGMTYDSFWSSLSSSSTGTSVSSTSSFGMRGSANIQRRPSTDASPVSDPVQSSRQPIFAAAGGSSASDATSLGQPSASSASSEL